MSGDDVSVIVPVRGDAEELDRLLTGLGNEPTECIVVCAGEDAAVRNVCRRHEARYVESIACRGTQQQTGALEARSRWLWFLHADAEPAADALDAIHGAAGRGAIGGYFRFRFRGRQSLARRLLADLINLRARLSTPYGDQGLFFRRDLFLACGGFPDEPLFEEVRLIRRIRLRGRFERLDTPIGVSPRRWERDGWIRRTMANRMLAMGYAMGLSPRRLARFYHGMRDPAEFRGKQE